MTRSSPDIPTGGPRYAHAPLHVPRAAGSLRQSHHSLLYPRGKRVLPHHRDNPEKNSPAPECRRRVSLSAGRIWTQRRLAPQPGSEKPDTAFSSSQAASDGLNRKPQISTDTRIARKNASFQNEEKHMKPTNLLAVILLAAGLVTTSAAAAGAASQKPISIERQGTFSAGGTVIPAKEPYNPMKPTPEGQTLHGDHASVFYQIPVHARKYPLVFLHGAGQSMRTWQTTPDGREGFRTFSCAAALASISSISRGAATPDAPPSRPPSRRSPTNSTGLDSSASASGPMSSGDPSSLRVIRPWISSCAR